jgi:hypothetical protein
VIVDFRYNGGGLVSIANLMGDLLGGNRSASEAFSHTTFRPEKSSNNSSRNFQPQPQSIASTKIAFIGTGGSASASELVINSFIPYLRQNAALIGSNTFGKPVGQIALDREACDDRLRVVAFRTENAARQGDYFDGLATKVEAFCRAGTTSPGRWATRWKPRLGKRSIISRPQLLRDGSGGITGQSVREPVSRELLTPAAPTPVQREVPGAF